MNHSLNVDTSVWVSSVTQLPKNMIFHIFVNTLFYINIYWICHPLQLNTAEHSWNPTLFGAYGMSPCLPCYNPNPEPTVEMETTNSQEKTPVKSKEATNTTRQGHFDPNPQLKP